MTIERLCKSLAQVYEREKKTLALPYDHAESVAAWLGIKAGRVEAPHANPQAPPAAIHYA